MKRVAKSDEPTMLSAFRLTSPGATWREFRAEDGAYRQTCRQLFSDQFGLCAYCEISLKVSDEELPRDQRVEHFHPKSPHSVAPNWALDWNNLLATCHGGSQRHLQDCNRFTAPDLSCDAVKGDADLDDVILNPLADISDQDHVFAFSLTGAISVDVRCPSALTAKAEATIEELNLDAQRLRRLRAEVVSALYDELEARGGPSDETLSEMARALFEEGAPPEFYSCKRYILRPASEERLRALGFY